MSLKPYARLYFGGRYLGKTKVVPKTLNPEWSETFFLDVNEFELSTIRGSDSNDLLTVDIFDKDIFTEDDYMGVVEVPLPLHLLEQGKHFTKELAEKYSTVRWYEVNTGKKSNKRN